MEKAVFEIEGDRQMIDKTIRLGDVATYVNGYAFKPSDRGEVGLPIIRIQDLTGNAYDLGFYDGEYPKRIEINNGDILISWSASLGVYVWNRGKALLNQHIFKVVFDKANVDKDYFVYAIKYNLGVMESKAHGATMKHIVKKDFDNTLIPYPSLDEQKSIAQKLDLVSRVIIRRQQELDKLDELVKARFVEMIESTDTAPTRMGDIATYINGYAFKPAQWEDSGYPIIRIQNLNDTNAPYNYYSGNLADKYLIHNGDVLVSWATHLEAYIWKGKEAWLNQHIFKVVFDKIEVDKTYFVYACEEALRQAFRNAHGFKPTMEHIKKADFDAAIVRLPNIQTQKEFATFVEQIDKSKFVVQKALDEAQLLFDSLMQKYFG